MSSHRASTSFLRACVIFDSTLLKNRKQINEATVVTPTTMTPHPLGSDAVTKATKESAPPIVTPIIVCDHDSALSTGFSSLFTRRRMDFHSRRGTAISSRASSVGIASGVSPGGMKRLEGAD